MSYVQFRTNLVCLQDRDINVFSQNRYFGVKIWKMCWVFIPSIFKKILFKICVFVTSSNTVQNIIEVAAQLQINYNILTDIITAFLQRISE